MVYWQHIECPPPCIDQIVCGPVRVHRAQSSYCRPVESVDLLVFIIGVCNQFCLLLLGCVIATYSIGSIYRERIQSELFVRFSCF